LGSGGNLGTGGLEGGSVDGGTSGSPLSGGQISGLTPARDGGGAARVGGGRVVSAVIGDVHPMADGEVSYCGDSGSKGSTAGVQKFNTCADTEDVSGGPGVVNSGEIVGEGVEGLPGHVSLEQVSIGGGKSSSVGTSGQGPAGDHTRSGSLGAGV